MIVSSAKLKVCELQIAGLVCGHHQEHLEILRA